MPTAFLDRDGVINRKAPEGEYITRVQDFQFLPGAIAGLRKLKRHGWKLIVVTNQRGVALGRMSADDLAAIHAEMCGDLRSAGVSLDGIYTCPHDKDVCDCRKPQTGLFHQARRDWPEIDFADSVVIGDSLSDMEAASHLGCRGIWIGHDAACIDEAADALFEQSRLSQTSGRESCQPA